MNSIIDFEKFKNKFKIFSLCNSKKETTNTGINVINEVFLNIGGAVYENGLFEIYDIQKSKVFSNIVEEEFENTKGKIVCFARDWLNNQLCITNYEPYNVLLFDLNFKEIYHLDINIKQFFENKIIEEYESIFLLNYYQDFLELNGALECGKCAGYKIPLILGGVDSIDNMDIVDCEVDAELVKQIYTKIRE